MANGFANSNCLANFYCYYSSLEICRWIINIKWPRKLSCLWFTTISAHMSCGYLAAVRNHERELFWANVTAEAVNNWGHKIKLKPNTYGQVSSSIDSGQWQWIELFWKKNQVSFRSLSKTLMNLARIRNRCRREWLFDEDGVALVKSIDYLMERKEPEFHSWIEWQMVCATHRPTLRALYTSLVPNWSEKECIKIWYRSALFL